MNPGQDGSRCLDSGARHVHSSISATRTIRSWSLRGWLATKLSGAPFAEDGVASLVRGTPNPGNSVVLADRAACPALHDGATHRMGFARDRRIPGGTASRHVARGPGTCAPGRGSIAAEMHSGFCDAAQRNDDVHSRARRRAALVARRSCATSRASTQIWNESRAAVRAGRRFPVRRVFACRCVLCTRRLPLPDLWRCCPRARRRRISSRAAGASVRCANGRRRRWPRRRSSRPTSRASSIATNSRPRARRDWIRRSTRLQDGCARRRRAQIAARDSRRRDQGFLRSSDRRRCRSTRAAYAGIVDYDPTELVVTARAGTRCRRHR